MRQRVLNLKLSPVQETESGIQQRIIEALSWHGWIVLSTVHRYRRQTCDKCGHNQWAKGGYGATKGIGDLLVAVPKQSPRLWLMLDVKKPGGKLSPEQQLLADKGLLVRVESEAEALAAIVNFEEGVMNDPGKRDHAGPPIPPGEILLQEMEARGWNNVETAKRLGWLAWAVNAFTAGALPMGAVRALDLERVFGASAEMWLNLEQAYRLKMAREGKGTPE